MASPSTLLSPTSLLSPSGSSTPRAASPSRPRIDLAFLQRPTLYQPIPNNHIPPPFLNSHHQPAPDASLSALLSQGHFRHAAARAADDLTSGSISNYDHATILSLYHTRLACLLLISRPEIAAQEAKPLNDYIAHNTPVFRGTAKRSRSRERGTPAALIPWDLRMLLQRLGTLASGDGRRGVMGLYALAAECRGAAQAAAREGDEEGVEVWRERLSELGISVAGELVEMGELEAAARHLESLGDGEDATAEPREMIQTRKALLWLRLGDVEAAGRFISGSPQSAGINTAILPALISITNGDYSSAAATLSDLHARYPSNELISQNLAVSLLYTGRITDAYQLAESQVDEGQHFPGLLFNLATMYELRTERAGERKMRLAERLAERGPGEDGWEKVGTEFKL